MKNHIASVCHAKKRQTRSRAVQNVESSDESSDNGTENYFFGLSRLNAMTSRPKIKIHVNEHPVNILIDTGSSINVMDESTYKAINQQPKLCKSDTKVYAYGANEKVSLLGKFQATVETSDKITSGLFYVTKGKNGNLLSYTTSVDFQLIPEIHSLHSSKAKQLIEKYPQVFKGIGKLKDTQIELHIDPNAQPVTQPDRRIPFHIKQQVEAELQRLEDLDIKEHVDGLTNWVSPIVVSPKPKSKGGYQSWRSNTLVI